MVPKIWGMTMFNEETIYSILEYIDKRDQEATDAVMSDNPVQVPFSRWAVYEIIGELKMDYTSYPDEVVRRFINLMKKYEEVAEPERKALFRTAKATAEDLYSYLFGDRKETNE